MFSVIFVAALIVVVVVVTVIVAGLSPQITKAQTSPSFVTYKDPHGRFSIQYPSSWGISQSSIIVPAGRVVEFDTPINNNNTNANTNNNTGFSSPIISSIIAPAKVDASFDIDVNNVTKYLDTKTLTLKVQTLADFVQGKISQINAASLPDSHGISERYSKDMAASVAGNPAWRVDYVMDFGYGIQEYIIETYMIHNDKLYVFTLSSEPLKIPETLPVMQQMLASFKLGTVAG